MNSSPAAGRVVWRLAWIVCLWPAALLLQPGCAAGSKPAEVRAAAQARSASEGTSQESGPEWFEDMTEALGLDFVHDPGPQGDYFTPHTIGSGCAFLHDGDGTLYLYLLQDAGPRSKAVNRLYRRTPAGRFEDVTAGSGLDVAGYSMGVAVGDVNNDGRPDVLLTQYGGVKLFLNQGGGKFRDATAESGLFDPLWAVSAAFVDYDRDGWLDLVVVNYLDFDPKRECLTPQGRRDFCGPSSFAGTCSKLFHNRTASAGKVSFEDVSFASGIGRLPGPGLGVACADFDGDGWPDVFVANDGQPNRLWINQHDGTFRDQALSRGAAYTMMGSAYAGMGVAVGSVANDGLLDLYVTHQGTETHTLWKQGPAGVFHDRSAQSGLTAGAWHGTGFGTLMTDFDNDGALDIALVNGRVEPGGPARQTGLGFWESYAQRNQLFANDGTGRFRDVSEAHPTLCGGWNVGRGLAAADFDNDGGVDLLLTCIGGRARLLRNAAKGRGHWLEVRALLPAAKRDAYGALVRVCADERQWLRPINPGESFLSSSSPIAHFGLGSAAAIERIVVTWPDGVCEAFPGGPADRLVELRQGSGDRVTR
jgi:hypothetical protein